MSGRSPPAADRAAGAVVARCAAGELSPEVALAQLLVITASGDGVEGVRRALDAAAKREAAGGAAVARLRALLAANPDGAAAVVDITRGGVDPAAPAASVEAALARCRDGFDRLVRRNPEASVALYSLGSPGILAAATAEVVARLDAWGVLGPTREVLDVGCGIGRFELALAPRVAAVTGIDVSPSMIAEARRRCTGLSNVRLFETAGRDLSAFGDRAFDAVLAVDAFPYLYAAGPEPVAAHVREAARVLRPGGDLVILNLSYRGDAEADRRDAKHLAAANGLAVLRSGVREFELWDALAFHLRKGR